MHPSPVEAYQVGVMCALPKEMTAARAMLDEEHEPLKITDAQDTNSYVLGRVHEHNVVIACLPTGVYGTNAAATVASNMLRTFPEIRFGLMVGIGGGIPNLAKEIDIRLGDVVVSQPDGTYGGVVQYDLGKNLGKEKFERKGSLDKPPTVLLTALASIQSRPGTCRRRVLENVSAMIQKPDLADENYIFPGVDQDHLYCTWCDRSQWPLWWWMIWLVLFSLSPLWLCNVCDNGKIPRSPGRRDPQIRYGIIASGNLLIKNAAERDRLAFAKELLSTVSPTAVHVTRHATDAMNHRTHELLGEGIQLQKQAIEVQREHSHKSEVRHLTEREQHCHQAFKTSTYERYKNINPKRVSGTCRWLLNHSQFRAWQQSRYHDLLWISADPGCGKSVLAKSLVDHEFGDADQHSVCYFFFKDNERQNNLNTALCAVLHQLFDHQPSLLRHALPAWDKVQDKIQQESEEMWRILLAAAADPSAGPIVCVLDALDECQDKDRQQLIAKLCDFYQRSSPALSGGRLKFLVTSRPYDNVQRWFEENTSHLPQIRLRGEDKNDQIHEEINLVMDRQIDSLATEFRLSGNHQERLRQSLRQMEHRTYLWLYLAMEDIRTTYRDSPDPEEEPTNTLPISVESAYERILERITEQQKSQARKILLIIVGVRRPLTISEMSLALNAASAHELGQSYIKKPNVQHLERHIRQWCGLFVFIKHSQLFLIHQTAKEFLVAHGSNFSSMSGCWKSTFSQTEIEGEMARLCVTYLCLRQQDRRPSDERRQGYKRADTRVPVVPRSTWEGQNKFFEYCAEHWTSHLREDVVTKDRKVLDRVLLLYATDTDQFHAWFPIMWKALYPYQRTAEVQIQHVVSMSDHAFVLNEIFHRAKFELEARDSTGRTALHWAAERGHEKVVEMLLAKHAEVNAQGGYYGNARFKILINYYY
ncbi:hypothetical protein EPUS_05670 [Endocarpon pusillum Z07020]|uniref:NACHT domain-containing protein n=1 Tax=Endocarpon pusillum (strain Z07020 / HMAS-L-300199) TaxID=1263415 RepID=U1GL72_ENDPU|nr:uncharacterized protein EPUS_05670 [Endocarpon pusillum Z07020]ERF72616.1 hypothetical protein EPUS_05670 [Endocarpon pusillum Z07020]